MGRGLAWLAILCTRPVAAQRSAYIGAQACGACHASEFARQSASPHAHSLYRAAEHPLAESFAGEGVFERALRFRFRFSREATGLRVRASDGQYLTELPLEWAFGAGVHAVTFVSQVSAEHYLEHSFSYYADSNSLDITPRHEELPADTLHEAMGQPLRVRGPGPAIVDCFRCHSTGPVSVSPAGEVRIGEPGVRCEACHGPGGAHRDAALRGDRRGAALRIRNPGSLSAESLNQLCGECHRALTADFHWESPWNVRHQPPFLGRSRCFRESRGRLSCLSCHDAHERARRADAAFYRARCLSCHAVGGPQKPAPACGEAAASDCTACHMPSVRANAHLRFPNHWIGVYRGISRLRPGG